MAPKINENEFYNNFKINEIVIYNPNIENLPPIHLRLHDIGIIISIDNSYAEVKFPYNNYKAKILFSSLEKAPPNIKLSSNQLK